MLFMQLYGRFYCRRFRRIT